MRECTSNPHVSIITVNYNSTALTRQLLYSLRKVTYKNIEIIVVDNGSKDMSCLNLRKEFPEIRPIRSEENLGFAGGNNLGIQDAKGDLILLINNDVEVSPDFLEPMVEIFNTKGNVGLVSPKIILNGEQARIQYAGSSGINLWTGRGKKNGYLQMDHGQYDYVSKTRLVHGACVMVSTEVICKAGMLPIEYFLYYEEHDWAESIKRAGFDHYYVGISQVVHKASGSIGEKNPLKTYHMTRSRLLYLRRNASGFSFWSSFLLFFCFSMPKNILMHTVNQEFEDLRAFLKGIAWHLNPSKKNGKVIYTGHPKNIKNKLNGIRQLR